MVAVQNLEYLLVPIAEQLQKLFSVDRIGLRNRLEERVELSYLGQGIAGEEV